MSDNYLISVRKCSKSYGEFKALTDISFNISRGEIVGFLGPNGAGKSTTMKLITGFLAPSGGEVLIDGSPVTTDNMVTRSKIGYLPENAPLYNDMMVSEFLEFIGQARHLGKKKFNERLAVVIESCGLQNVLGKDISTLSKGYRQRVGLAQAIIHDPPILILDEPTSGLDPNQIVDIRALIKRLGQEKTVILSTHILPEVQATCNRVLIINRGKLVADDSPTRLLNGHERHTLFLGLLNKENGAKPAFKQVKEVLAKIDGVKEIQPQDDNGDCLRLRLESGDRDIRLGLYQILQTTPWAIVELTPKTLSLEETFRKLTINEATTEA